MKQNKLYNKLHNIFYSLFSDTHPCHRSRRRCRCPRRSRSSCRGSAGSWGRPCWRCSRGSGRRGPSSRRGLGRSSSGRSTRGSRTLGNRKGEGQVLGIVSFFLKNLTNVIWMNNLSHYCLTGTFAGKEEGGGSGVWNNFIFPEELNKCYLNEQFNPLLPNGNSSSRSAKILILI